MFATRRNIITGMHSIDDFRKLNRMQLNKWQAIIKAMIDKLFSNFSIFRRIFFFIQVYIFRRTANKAIFDVNFKKGTASMNQSYAVLP